MGASTLSSVLVSLRGPHVSSVPLKFGVSKCDGRDAASGFPVPPVTSGHVVPTVFPVPPVAWTQVVRTVSTSLPAVLLVHGAAI